MKSNHTHWLARSLLCAAALAACLLLALYFAGVFAGKPGIGFLSTDTAHLAVDHTVLEKEAAALDVPFLQDHQKGSLGQRGRALIDQGAGVLVIDLNRTLTAQEQQSLRELALGGTILLFAGYDPGESFLESCNDLAWYVGCDSAQAGEVLGAQLAQLYRNGIAADLNGDNLLQYVWVADTATAAKNSLLEHSLEECEHYGVYSVDTGKLEASADTLSQDIEASLCSTSTAADSHSAPAEVILCSSADAIYAALEARSAADRPDLPVIGFAANAQQAQELAQAGAAALSVYDRSGVSQALAQLAQTALAQQALTDTGLVPTGHTFLQSFFPYEF